MTAPRTPEQVTREIEREREQLALAVSHLRDDLHAATDVKAILRAKAPQITRGALAAAAVLTLLRLLRRKRHKPVERANFGRFKLVEHP